MTALSQSFIESGKDYWTYIYNSFFPTYVSQSIHDMDMDYQQKGIDRVIHLNNGKQIFIDEKVRYKDFGDILLEESSSIEDRSPGWIEKPLWTDYIAYLVIPANKCFLLPFLSTQLAWRQNKEEWKKIYTPIKCNNQTYTSLSWGIPLNVLYIAILKTQIINYAN